MIKSSPSDGLARRQPQSRATLSRNLKEGLIKLVCLLCALISIFTTFGIVFVLLREAIHFFREVSPLEFFGGTKWSPLFAEPKFGVLPLITGTLMITVGSGLIAVPLGLLAAIYLSEYARPAVRNVLKPVLEILAGIPTVVYGFFGIFFVTPLLQKLDPEVQVYNAASGAIVVGVMILPLVSSLCEDAITAVPKSLREGAYGLGATKFEVSTKIVVPAALSGIMASFILALSRAIGETMAVTLAAGMDPKLTLDPRESIQTMTSFIVMISKGDTPAGTTGYYTLFAVGLTLFAMTMIMNFIAVRLVKRFRQVYH
ncbi:MAG TPA: phosphate ABC transporter permease subunit PstC [Fimbriimonadaceae bacterium]|nr:phosphate ABC transporter permease subunit PstC [Fimbriimonadaceae bacterium]